MSSLLSLSASKATYNPVLLRWAAGGWAFFIAENAILSENRTWLISEFGDDQYHLAYGTCSTIATASIGYGYYSIRQAKRTTRLYKGRIPPIPHLVGGWMVMSLGLIMASQAAPKMQIPVTLQDNHSIQVRCPFDFSGKHQHHHNNNNIAPSELQALERITRHPGLWSLGFVGLGQALLVPTLPQRIWFLGPAAVACLGGAHTDSRFRRGMGGTLSPIYDSQTSNLPFWAMICGKQGNDCWQAMISDIKPLNAALAVAASSLWVLRLVR